MSREWKPGDCVSVATVNRGLPVWSKQQDVAQSWAGEIVGPSLVGAGWWNVRRQTPSGGKRGAYVFAVPDSEIMPRD